MGISSALGSSALLPAGLGFRNKIINGDFSVNQRGFTTTTTTDTIGFDRWLYLASDGTVTYSSQAFALGNMITGQEPTNHARIVSSGQTLASAYAIFRQKIESVRTLAGQQVTISFWAKASSGTPKVAVELEQFFGGGGSPSANTFNYGGQVTLSTSWVRYITTITVPSLSGKTIGTSNDWIALNLWSSAGSNFNARTGTLGIQSTTIDYWGIQVEQNYQPTSFEQRPISVELALCQRYYYTSGIVFSQFIANNSNKFGEGFSFQFPVTMRATPTLAGTFVSNDNAVLLNSAVTDKSVYIRETCNVDTFPYSSFTYSYTVAIEL